MYKVLSSEVLQELLNKICAEIKSKSPLTHSHEISDITNLQSTLNNKSDSGHTHDMLDIDGLTETIGNIHSFDVKVVDSLPDVSSGLERTIYFVPREEPNTNNIYDEYLLINSSFELIGDTQIDLTNYATKEEVATELNGKSNVGHTHATGDVVGLQEVLGTFETMINGKADIDSMCDYLYGGNASSNQIPSGADLNNYTSAGVYFSDGSNITSTLLNCPTTENAGRLEVIQLNSNTQLAQRWIQRKDAVEWTRSRSGSGSWTAWNKTIKESDLNVHPNLYYCGTLKERTYDSVNLIIREGTHLYFNGTDDGGGTTFYSPTGLDIDVVRGQDYEVQFKVISGSVSFDNIDTTGDYISFYMVDINGNVTTYQRYLSTYEFTSRMAFTAKFNGINQYTLSIPTGVSFDNLEVELIIRKVSYIKTETNVVDSLTIGNYTLFNNSVDDTLNIMYNGGGE